MSYIAVDRNSNTVVVDNFTDEEWARLKATYTLGDYRTHCCSAIAIPKTSQYGNKFFAHHAGECGTSPESIWHKETKLLLLNVLNQMAIEAQEEVAGGSTRNRWIADIYFELGDRKIAIEIQHSYQHLREYTKRQTKYTSHGVEAYWLLYPDRYPTIIKSIAVLQVKTEFGGKFPPGIPIGCMPNLPLMLYTLEPERLVRGMQCPGYLLNEWIQSIIDKRFIFVDRVWKIA